MKKLIFILIATVATVTAQAQSGRGVRIGYIDMNYILENVPDYIEAKNQLELKAQKWKQEIEAKKNEITKLKEDLAKERVLLTKQLIEEKEEEITYQEQELAGIQLKRFGPEGDYFVQKTLLVKPVQDQVFTAIQDIAEQKKYDFIFDKSSDLTMIFSAKRFDISEQVIRTIARSSKRTQKSKKEIQEEEKKEYEENLEDENPALAERRKRIEAKKAERDKLIEDRKAAAQAKKDEAAAKRQAAVAARNNPKAEKNPTDSDSKPEGKPTKEAAQTTNAKPGKGSNTASDSTYAAKPTNKPINRDSIAAVREAQRKAKLAEREAAIAKRKQEIEDKKAQAAANRQNGKKPTTGNTEGTKPEEQGAGTPKNNN